MQSNLSIISSGSGFGLLSKSSPTSRFKIFSYFGTLLHNITQNLFLGSLFCSTGLFISPFMIFYLLIYLFYIASFLFFLYSIIFIYIFYIASSYCTFIIILDSMLVILSLPSRHTCHTNLYYPAMYPKRLTMSYVKGPTCPLVSNQV